MDALTSFNKLIKRKVYSAKNIRIELNQNYKLKSVISSTKSWKCCKCRCENYLNEWTCSYCSHERCRSCKDLIG